MADSNKTEEATPKRRNKAREQGQVARSRELSGALVLVGVGGVISLIAPISVKYWTMLYRETLDLAATSNLDMNGPLLFWPAVEVMRWITPILLAAFAVSFLTSLAQGGFNIAPEALAPKFERFNPVSKLGQMFSPVGLGNLAKSLLPFAAIVWVISGVMRSNWGAMVFASGMGLRQLATLIGSMLFEVAWKAILILLVWGVIDYLLIRRKMSSDLKMTKQEIKDEFKESDGNPVIKQRIRKLQRSMRRAQTLKAAATATVVITNPTHFAVALRYEADMAAPIVVAKGKDLIAQQIKAIAREAGIMTIENKPLAQALFKTVEVGDTIPGKLYQAVAEILVLVYKAQAEVRQREAARRSRNASGQQSGPAKAPMTLQAGAAR